MVFRGESGGHAREHAREVGMVAETRQSSSAFGLRQIRILVAKQERHQVNNRQDFEVFVAIQFAVVVPI